MSDDYPLIAIAGPTATGKSDLALFLARALGGEVVNYDAMQVYRGLDIGTAKVAAEVRREVPHHLLDVAEIGEFFSAGRYRELAAAALAGIRTRGRVPILAGGTGFYLRALLRGLFEGPERDEALRARFQRIADRRGCGPLHRMLQRHDPAAAGRIAPNDYPRIARALEVLILTGVPLSRHFGASERPLEGFAPRLYGLNLPREELYRRIDRRVEAMLAAGLLDEVRGLLAAGHDSGAKGLEAIGYRQAAAFLRGETTYLAMAESIQRETRRYAKRQLTWFRKEPGVIWIDGAGDDPAVQRLILADIRSIFPF
jgi:tRNA dimethylallyltransferase